MNQEMSPTSGDQVSFVDMRHSTEPVGGDANSLDYPDISLLEYLETRLANKKMLKLIFWNLT